MSGERQKSRPAAKPASQQAPNRGKLRLAGGGSEELRRLKAEIFQALAHPTRIAIVELLRNGELSAGQLIERLGVEQANASQHLAVLRSKQIVINRKEANQVFYSLRDPVLIEVLDILKRYFYSQLSQTMSMLKEIESPERARKG
jgi:DNA-binding transcriptional ArsR family regulator